MVNLNKKELGQVLTNPEVADLMVSLIQDYVNEKSLCLDPCIGKNIFFKKLSEKVSAKLTGIEIDKSMVDSDISEFFNDKDRKLIIDDFFNLPLNNKFNTIILNPPYVRQELLDSDFKKHILNSLNKGIKDIPKKSNLYVYFLIKSLQHLEERGHLIAIVYDSWLYTDFGKIFKENIIKDYSIEKIIHFKKGAFDKVNVGATIILFQKGAQEGDIEYYDFNSPKDISLGDIPNKKVLLSLDNLFNFHLLNGFKIDFSSGIFKKMGELSEIPVNRGMSAIVNKFFLFSDNTLEKYTKKIIKDITKIKGYSVNKEYDSILLLNKDAEGDQDVMSYLLKIIDEVKRNEKSYKALSKKIKENNNWYLIKEKKPGNIIFNYYIRNNITFIYNPNKYLVSDNFYNLHINKYTYANLSILNSTISRAILYNFSRNQGRGLFKIQLKQFIDIPVLDINLFEEKDINQLEKLGKKLIEQSKIDSIDIINNIDNLLISQISKHQKERITKEDLLNFIDKLKGKEK